MATTKDSMKEEGAEFGAAFDENTPPPVEQTDDEAFGLTLPDAADTATQGDGETDGSAVAVQAGEGAETTPAAADQPPAGELPVEPPAEEVAAAEAEAAAGEDAMPEMTQAEKSWEGRLRKREEELKALAADLDARKNTPVDPAIEETDEGESPAEEAAEGEASDADEAMRQLSEDFGPEFVKMICAIAAKKAEESAGVRVEQIGRTLNDVIDDIKNSRARRHFKDIQRAHPDFVEIHGSDAFKAWIAAMAPADKVEAERIEQAGDADEINGLLAEFKAANQKTGETTDNESAIDAAEGVRSTGMRLPNAPAAGQDAFAAAWDELS